jgi:potassium-transporting ATPase KdpC subunit
VARTITTSVLAVLVLTVLLGLAYPLAITGVAQVAFPHQANGSRLGAGSELLATDAAKDRGAFQPRPSATEYSATATFFANRGPNQRTTRALTGQHLRAYLARERPYDPGLTARDVPVDAVTFSASGVDPHISVANARIQARRVAAVRRLSPERVAQLIDAHTDGRFLGVFGEPGVNVTTLNHALGQEAR